MTSENIEPKQRRRPQQARANHTYEMIVAAAAHVLDENGEAAFTTNRVAERAGVSIGSLYQYFQDKQAILVALAEREENQLLPNPKLLASAASKNESPLRLGLRSYINMLPDNPIARARAMAEIMEQRGPEGVASIIDKRFRESGLCEGLSDVDRYVLSRAVTGVVQSAVREQKPDLYSRAFEDSLVKLVRAFLRMSA